MVLLGWTLLIWVRGLSTRRAICYREKVGAAVVREGGSETPKFAVAVWLAITLRGPLAYMLQWRVG